MKRWTPYHMAIPLKEGEIPMNKGGVKSVEEKSLYSSLEAVVKCEDCKWRGTTACFCKAPKDVRDDWFCSEGEKR